MLQRPELTPVTRNMLLQHLIDSPDPCEAYEPLVERAPIETLIRPPGSTREELKAKAQSAAALLAHGMEATLDEAEDTTAMQQFNNILQSRVINPATLVKPGVILKLTALLSEYDHQVVRDAQQMRTYVTNRLLQESDPKMPAGQRLRALNLLGQITGVDLFTERSEITVRTMPTENLEAALHAKLITLLPSDYKTVTDAA